LSWRENNSSSCFAKNSCCHPRPSRAKSAAGLHQALSLRWVPRDRHILAGQPSHWPLALTWPNDDACVTVVMKHRFDLFYRSVFFFSWVLSNYK
jgi:hypothetical protein